MSRSEYGAYLDGLAEAAREASIAEEAYRKEVARRADALRTQRAFAYRRLNLLRLIGGAVTEAEGKDEALRAGRAVFMRETALAGVNEQQKEVVERFSPVVLAIWAATRPDGEDGDGDADVGKALAAFESWYEDGRGRSFLHLMEQEIVELPLVEV